MDEKSCKEPEVVENDTEERMGREAKTLACKGKQTVRMLPRELWAGKANKPCGEVLGSLVDSKKGEGGSFMGIARGGVHLTWGARPEEELLIKGKERT